MHVAVVSSIRPRRAPFRVWRHPLMAYFLLAFGVTWLCEVVLFGLLRLPLLPWMIPAAFSPALAAFLVTGATAGRSGVRDLWHLCIRWRVGVRWYPLVSVAFGIYWIVWGLLVPVMLLGWPTVRGLYRGQYPGLGARPWLAGTLLVVPIVGGFVAAFLPRLDDLTPLVFLVLVARALCNAAAEELFWRGVYIRLFPRDPIRGYLYPALAFGAWHVVPQSVVAFGGGSAALVLGACFIGLGYGWVAWRTGTIRWTTLAHIGTDAMGIGAVLVALGH